MATDTQDTSLDEQILARLTRIEESLAHQQRLCEQLNDVVTSQSTKLRTLEKMIPRLERQVKELGELGKSDSPPPADDRPPHY